MLLKYNMRLQTIKYKNVILRVGDTFRDDTIIRSILRINGIIYLVIVNGKNQESIQIDEFITRYKDMFNTKTNYLQVSDNSCGCGC